MFFRVYESSRVIRNKLHARPYLYNDNDVEEWWKAVGKSANDLLFVIVLV